MIDLSNLSDVRPPSPNDFGSLDRCFLYNLRPPASRHNYHLTALSPKSQRGPVDSRVVFHNSGYSPPSDLQPFHLNRARRPTNPTSSLPRQRHQTLAASPDTANTSPNAARCASHDEKLPCRRFTTCGKGATLRGVVQDYADIRTLWQPKPYRALTLSTMSMTCLERHAEWWRVCSRYGSQTLLPSSSTLVGVLARKSRL